MSRRVLLLVFAAVLIAAAVVLPWWLKSFDVRIELVDASTGSSTSARMLIRSSDRLHFIEPDPERLTHTIRNIGPFLHVDHSVEVRARRGRLGLIAMRGITSHSDTRWFEIQSDTTLVIAVGDWVEPREFGWIGGDPHMHPEHTGGKDYHVRVTVEDCARAARAEGLDVMFLLANDAEHPSGPVEPAADGVTLVWGEEYRNSFWGHVVMLDVPELVVTELGATCCGKAQPAWPTLESTLTEHRPPVALMAHPHTTDHPEETHPWPGSGFARELPALALRPRLQGVAVVGATNGPASWYLDPWLDGLRLGRRWSAVGESDRALDRYQTGPPGDPRTYVWLEDPLPKGDPRLAAQWLEGLRAGRSFATTGPILRDFRVGGARLGDLVDTAPGRDVEVRLSVQSKEPLEEIVLIGAEGIHSRWPWPDSATSVDTTVTLRFEHDDFVALRVHASTSWSRHQFPAGLVATPVWVRTGLPWQTPPEVLERAREALLRFWQSSIDERGYASPADSLTAHGQVMGAARRYREMLESPPDALVSLRNW